MKHIINFVRSYIECLPMAAEAEKTKSSATVNEEETETRRLYDDEVLDGPSSAYADITSLICEVFLKIAVQYCHANMEYSVVNACLKAEFYKGTLTYRIPAASQNVEPSSASSLENDMIFSSENKVRRLVNGVHAFSMILRVTSVTHANKTR